MKRVKKHRIKREMPESSQKRNEEHDLAYYIHDRVELMHQVFSVMKHKELRAMAPESVRHISLDDLQELCTEELLGISSKRLCAILDGADPPSNTESSSSSPDRLETISLDSISSDEEILSQGSSKKSKKHKHHRHSKCKSKQKRKGTEEGDGGAEGSRASRAGLTVLELLELQARARAIRAQLQQHQPAVSAEQTATKDRQLSGDDDEVMIKEEAPEVVEISSEDEKPSINELEKKAVKPKPSNNETIVEENTKTVTKRINDLIITVPQSKTTRKIKLNRNNSVRKDQVLKTVAPAEVPKQPNSPATVKQVCSVEATPKDKKSKKKQKKKDKQKDKDGSDHDEITLQLSDTEKMDLLEDFERKCDSSEDSESSSDSSDSQSSSDDEKRNKKVTKKTNDMTDKDGSEKASTSNENPSIESNLELIKSQNTKISNTDNLNSDKSIPDGKICLEVNEVASEDNKTVSESGNSISLDEKSEIGKLQNSNLEVTNIPEKEDMNVSDSVKDIKSDEINGSTRDVASKIDIDEVETSYHEKSEEASRNANKDNNTLREESSLNDNKNTEPLINNKTKSPEKSSSQLKDSIVDVEDGEIINKDLSDGEVSEESLENKEAKTEVVCISDDEKRSKKKKKKEKKSKKSKNSDFRESADQNFYKITTGDSMKVSDGNIIANIDLVTDNNSTHNNGDVKVENDSKIVVSNKKQAAGHNSGDSIDDVFEYLELSDDSSCYEVEGVSVLSKEPTTEEIVALSAKIDEIERVDVVTDEEIKHHESLDKDKGEMREIGNISWKDRYLESKKVKSVLSTANILNALRKKNKELKKKIEQSQQDKVVETPEVAPLEDDETCIEGSIDHYNTLQGSTKFVDPIKEVETVPEERPTKEMEKDAKQLLKMYKKLLKYNDINKKKDRTKKKKKKQKKSKEKDKDSDKNKS